MFAHHLHRVFWGIYGKYAWDAVELPIEKRMIRAAVGILSERRKLLGETVLDCGCGTGNYAVSLAEAGFHVTGIDYSPGMLTVAQTKISPGLSGQLLFKRMDMNQHLLFADVSFDHVISMTSLWMVANPSFTLGEFGRVLKTGGTLVVMQIPRVSGNLKKTIRDRMKHLKRKNPVAVALIVFKTMLERTSMTKYWTQEELLALILSNKQLRVSYVDPGPPFFVVASKR